MVSVVNYCSLQKSLTVEQRLESSVQTRKPLKVDAEPNSPEIVRNEPDGNKKVETQDLLKYKCSLCNEQFKREDRLNRHLFSHTKQVENAFIPLLNVMTFHFLLKLSEIFLLRSRRMLEAIHKQVPLEPS